MRRDVRRVHDDTRTRGTQVDFERDGRSTGRGLRPGFETDFALAGRQPDEDLRQQLRIEQRAVQLAMGIVDVEPLAQCIQRVALAGEALAREQQRVLDGAAVGERAVLRAQQAQFVVEEADVEGRIVDHQLGAFDKGEEFVGDGGEQRLVGEELQRQTGDFLRAGFEFALGIEVTVEGAASRAALHHLDAADFHDAVAAGPAQAGGFCVEDDLAHRALLAVAGRKLKAWRPAGNDGLQIHDRARRRHPA